MHVSDVMTRGVECTAPEATLQEAAERMKTLNIGCLPICDHDRLVGIVTDRDITVRSIAEGHDPWTDRVRDAMTPRVYYCFESQDVADAAKLMRDKQVRRLPVLDGNKHLVGIVSLGDLAVETGDKRLAGKALEAISEPCGPQR